MCDEAEVTQEPKKSIIEEELKQCFEAQGIMGVCGKTDRSCRRKNWQLSQSSNTESQNLEQDLGRLHGSGQRKRLGQGHWRKDKSLGSR